MKEKKVKWKVKHEWIGPSGRWTVFVLASIALIILDWFILGGSLGINIIIGFLAVLTKLGDVEETMTKLALFKAGGMK